MQQMQQLNAPENGVEAVMSQFIKDVGPSVAKAHLHVPPQFQRVKTVGVFPVKTPWNSKASVEDPVPTQVTSFIHERYPKAFGLLKSTGTPVVHAHARFVCL